LKVLSGAGEVDIGGREFFDKALAAAVAAGDFTVANEQIGRLRAVINSDRARDVFSVFRRTIRPGMLWNPFVDELTYELVKFYEDMVAGKRPKLAISAPPQHGKSWAAEDFIAWLAGKNPDLKTIYASYSEELGVMRNLNLQRLFTSQRYNEIFPELKVGEAHSRGLRTNWQLNSNLIEYVERVGSFRNTTVRGQITGMEQHLGVIDDFVKGRAEATSKVERDKTWFWFSDDFMPRMNKDSAVLIIATRWHLDDLIGRLIKKFPEMRCVTFTAIAEKDEGWRKQGEALFEELKPLKMLLEQKRMMTEGSWQAEYIQRPFAVGAGQIPIEKLRVIPYFKREDIAECVMSVDKAGTEGGDGAYTAAM
jgi:hypothetical protein